MPAVYHHPGTQQVSSYGDPMQEIHREFPSTADEPFAPRN